MKANLLTKFILIAIICGIATSTVIYCGWYFDDFFANSAFQGIALLIAFISTLIFFSYFTVDFFKNKAPIE